jgi:hypothetical protein
MRLLLLVEEDVSLLLFLADLVSTFCGKERRGTTHRVPQVQSSVLVSRDDELVKTTPSRNSRLTSTRLDRELRLLVLLLRALAVDREDGDTTGVTHTLLSNGENARVVLGPGDALDGGGELPGVEALAGANVPELEHVVGGSRDEVGRGGCRRRKVSLRCIRSRSCGVRTVNAHRPDGSVVAVVGTEALAVVAVPGVDDMVLRAGKEEIALAVIDDFCSG